MNRLNYIILTSFLIFQSCGNKTKDESTISKAKNIDSLQTNTSTDEKKIVSNNEEFISQAKKIDAWVQSFDKADSIDWEYTYRNEYDESFEATIYENKNGEFYKMDLTFSNDNNVIHYMVYNFDKEGDLCLMEEWEVRLGYWQDDIVKMYYMKEGNPYWLHQYHVYKADTVFDTTYTPGPFTDDAFPIFYDKKYVIEKIMSQEPNNL